MRWAGIFLSCCTVCTGRGLLWTKPLAVEQKILASIREQKLGSPAATMLRTMTLSGARKTYAVEDVCVVEANGVDSISSFFVRRCHGAERVEPAAATATWRSRRPLLWYLVSKLLKKLAEQARRPMRRRHCLSP